MDGWDQNDYFYQEALQEKEKKKKSAMVELKGEDTVERLLQVWDCVSQDELGPTPQVLAEPKPYIRLLVTFCRCGPKLRFCHGFFMGIFNVLPRAF